MPLLNVISIPVEVNNVPLKAFVDSGAQQTISKHLPSSPSISVPDRCLRLPVSPECAERCGIMRLLDKRFAGVARGVGPARILGRVHYAQLKLDDLHLSCAFTIMEGRDVDLLFGLDMLKAHQACIDLEKNCLRIRGREVRFLSEHELPEQARQFENPQGGLNAPGAGAANPSSSAGPSSSSGQQREHFPGSGNTLGATPGSAPGVPVGGAAPRAAHPEASIETLMSLGATRQAAIEALDAMNGNVDYAASLLFQF